MMARETVWSQNASGAICSLEYTNGHETSWRRHIEEGHVMVRVVRVAAFGWVFVCITEILIQFALGSCYAHAHKRIVNIMKMYIERNNKHVKLIRFRKQIAPLLTLKTLKWEYSFATAVFTKLGSLCHGPGVVPCQE